MGTEGAILYKMVGQEETFKHSPEQSEIHVHSWGESKLKEETSSVKALSRNVFEEQQTETV